jgi:hypothetical protein
MNKIIAFVFVLVCAISNAQPVVRNHDLNLGPDRNYCGLDTLHFDPFLEFPAHSQTLRYTTSVISYSPDTNITGTSLTGLTDDCTSKNIPIGFNFTYFGVDYNYLRLNANAFLVFGNPPQNANSVNFPQGNGCYTTTDSVCNNFNWNNSGLGFLGSPNNSLPTNAIFFGKLDLNPLIGGQIKYELSGVEPNRKLTIKYINVPYLSCSTKLYNAQVKLYETTNIIEIHILKIESCSTWIVPRIIGLQGPIPSLSRSVSGYNNTSFQFADSKAWQFNPSGAVPPSLNQLTIKWKNLSTNQITYSQSSSIVPQSGDLCYTANIVINNPTHTNIPCGSNITPDTICFTQTPANFPIIAFNNDTLYTGIFNSYQWYLNDSIIPGANAYNYIPTATGFYKVQTDSSGCTAFSLPFNFIYVGLNKNRSSNFGLDVYPNPFTKTFTIKCNNKLDKATLSISNIAGENVYQSNCLNGNETNIDVSELSRGIYIIELNNNGAVERRKLVKE